MIRKGRHYPFTFFPVALPFWVKRKDINVRKAKFMFTDSCMFDLQDEDQHDVNKLFGFSIGHHQKRSSFRFGWRPILSENKIEIVAYEYHDGVRQPTMPICRVELNKWHNCRIIYLPNIQRTYYEFGETEFMNNFQLQKRWGLGYTLGIYFGGNEKAPHKITIFKDKFQ